MNIYIIRHGTTVWNEKQIIQGLSNNRLSKNGIRLVEQSALSFSKVKLDIIYSSPLMRTMQTANIINKYYKVKIIKDRRLIESDEGIFTRKYKSTLSKEEIYAHNYRLDQFGIETWQSVHDRMLNFINNIKKNCKFENILIVTHDLPATCLENILLKNNIDYTQELMYEKNFNNAEIRHYKI